MLPYGDGTFSGNNCRLKDDNSSSFGGEIVVDLCGHQFFRPSDLYHVVILEVVHTDDALA